MEKSIYVYVWYYLNGQVATFAGHDHVNLLTNTYTSYNVDKILNLARKLATQYKTEIIEEYESE